MAYSEVNRGILALLLLSFIRKYYEACIVILYGHDSRVNFVFIHDRECLTRL